MDSLIEWLVNYAFDHNIGVVLTPALQPHTPSTSDGTTRLVVINMNWYRKTEIPFALAHEIGHSDSAITREVYLHVTNRAKRKYNSTILKLK